MHVYMYVCMYYVCVYADMKTNLFMVFWMYQCCVSGIEASVSEFAIKQGIQVCCDSP